jgi:proline racemase
MRKPASRGDTGSSNAFRQVSVLGSSVEHRSFQAQTIANRFRLSPATARAVAELAFPATDNWRGRHA